MQNLSETKNSYESVILDNLSREIELKKSELDSFKSSLEKTKSNAPYSVNLKDDGTTEVSIFENGEFSRTESVSNMEDLDKLLDSLDQTKKKSLAKSETKLKHMESEIETLSKIFSEKDFAFTLSFSKGEMVADFTSSDFARTKILNSLAPKLVSKDDEASVSDFPETPDTSETEPTDDFGLFSGLEEGELTSTTKETDRVEPTADTHVETSEAESAEGSTDLFDFLNVPSSVPETTSEDARNDSVTESSTDGIDDFGFFDETETVEVPVQEIEGSGTSEPVVSSELEIESEATPNNGALSFLFGESADEERLVYNDSESEGVIATDNPVDSAETDEPTIPSSSEKTVSDDLEDMLFGRTETPTETVSEVEVIEVEVSEPIVNADDYDPLGFLSDEPNDSERTVEADVSSTEPVLTEGVLETASSEDDFDPLGFFETANSENRDSTKSTESVEPIATDSEDVLSVQEFDEELIKVKTGKMSSANDILPVLAEPENPSDTGEDVDPLAFLENPSASEKNSAPIELVSSTDVEDPLEGLEVSVNESPIAETSDFVRTEVQRPEIQGKSKDEIENERLASEFLKHVKSITIKFPPNNAFTVRKEGYLDKLSNREKILTVVAGVSFTTAVIALIFASYAVDGSKFDQSVIEAQLNQKINDLTEQVKSLEAEKEELVSVKKANEEKEAPIAGSAKNLTINSIEKIKIDEESDPKMSTSVIKNKYLVVKMPSLKPEAGKKLTIVLKSGETVDYVIKRAITGSSEGILKIIENQEKELASKPESQRYFVLVGTDAKQYFIAQP